MTDSDRPRKRQKQPTVTLYDAVAGRLGDEGFLREPHTSKHRDTITEAGFAVPPEEILFRSHDAPLRYAEDDIYFANRHLKADQRLPDSGLLSVLHRYVTDFYGSAGMDRNDSDSEEEPSWESLDETALLALGMLIEEAAVEALGEDADLALLMGADGKG